MTTVSYDEMLEAISAGIELSWSDRSIVLPDYTLLNLQNLRVNNPLNIQGCQFIYNKLYSSVIIGAESFAYTYILPSETPFSLYLGIPDKRLWLSSDAITKSIEYGYYTLICCANISGNIHLTSEKAGRNERVTLAGAIHVNDATFDGAIIIGQRDFKEVVVLKNVIANRVLGISQSRFLSGLVIQRSQLSQLGFSDVSFFERADFSNSSFDKKAEFLRGWHLENERCVYDSCVFYCKANFFNTIFKRGLSIPGLVVTDRGSKDFELGSSTRLNLNSAQIHGTMDVPAGLWNLSLGKRTVEYLSDMRRERNRIRSYKGFGEWRRQRRYFPKISVANIDVGSCTEPEFRRWAQDTSYLQRFRQRHPYFYWIWLISSDCGRSFSLWLLWSIVFAFGFAGIFSGFVKTFWMNGEVGTIGFRDALYFSIVAFTTLGFGDITPATGPGKVAVASEVALGYLMLGGLISIFADKLARRS